MVAALVLTALPHGPARAQASEVSATPPATPQAPISTSEATADRTLSFTLRTPLVSAYTSNLFLVKERRLASFRSQRDPGERFSGMDEPWDVYVRPSVRGTVVVPVGRKRDVEIELLANYYVHQNNRIADFLKLGAGASYEPTRRDTLVLEATLAPRRFKKNYRGPVAYEHAYAQELELVARHDHEWPGPVATRLEYAFSRNAFEDPFHNRNELGHQGTASLSVKATRALVLKLGAGLGTSSSPGEEERGVVVDRSFGQWLVFGGARLRAAGADVDASVEYRARSYGSSVVEDLNYYQRDDHRIRLGIDVTKKLASGFSVGAFAQWTRNYSDRVDAAFTADEEGYRETVVGILAAWRYSSGPPR